jgi:sec-independent protein translocase protein TatA
MANHSTIIGLLGGLGGWEVILILAIVLLLFGAKRLPEIARSLGRSLKEFKKGTKEIKDEFDIQDDIEDADYKQEKKSDKLPPKQSSDKNSSSEK